MALITQSGPETLPIGAQGPDFNDLPGTDGKSYSLGDFRNSKAVVVSFTCNHCPYAQAYDDRFIALANRFGPKGFSFLAINPNDEVNYPDDSFENMKVRAREKGFPYPYIRDESQQVARAYGAVCTPHIFVLDAEGKIVYEGRLDDNWQEPGAAKAHDLRDTLEAIDEGRPVPHPNTNPLGCSIKWKAD